MSNENMKQMKFKNTMHKTCELRAKPATTAK